MDPNTINLIGIFISLTVMFTAAISDLRRDRI